MAESKESVAKAAEAVIREWLQSCTRTEELSRNTIVVGIKILDSLRTTCPLPKNAIGSPGGEVKGVRSGLNKLLPKYGVPADFLRAATGRQAWHDAERLLDDLNEGEALVPMSPVERDEILCSLLDILAEEAHKWLARQNIKVRCKREISPGAWVGQILAEAKGKSGGSVEQHLVGAKLSRAFPEIEIPALPGAAADLQTKRAGDFQVGTTVYHVTAAPGEPIVRKCQGNLDTGLHPVLLVPGKQKPVAEGIVDRLELADKITVISIEDFLSVNILEMSKGRKQEFIVTLRSIIDEYNRRVEAAETDKSLRIEIE